MVDRYRKCMKPANSRFGQPSCVTRNTLISMFRHVAAHCRVAIAEELRFVRCLGESVEFVFILTCQLDDEETRETANALSISDRVHARRPAVA